MSLGHQESSCKDSDYSLKSSGPISTVGAPKVSSESINPSAKFPNAVVESDEKTITLTSRVSPEQLNFFFFRFIYCEPISAFRFAAFSTAHRERGRVRLIGCVNCKVHHALL